MKMHLWIIAAILLCTPVWAQVEDTTTLTKVGQAVPNFTVTTLDGNVVKIAELKGTVVLINFFATWCGPCMGEMPHIEKDIWQQLKGEKFLVLAIGREHSKDELIKFNKEKGFTFPIAPDPKRGVYSHFAKQFIPRNVVVGKDGKIAYQSMGYTKEEFEAMIGKIKSLLKEPSRP